MRLAFFPLQRFVLPIKLNILCCLLGWLKKYHNLLKKNYASVYYVPIEVIYNRRKRHRNIHMFFFRREKFIFQLTILGGGEGGGGTNFDLNPDCLVVGFNQEVSANNRATLSS